MNRAVILFIFGVHLRLSNEDSKFDFGLFENEPFLKTVLTEDRKFSAFLEENNNDYQDKTLNKFLSTQTRVTEKEDFIQHPINAYLIIKKYALIYPGMVEKLSPVELQNKIQAKMNSTEQIKHISLDDFKRSINALVQIIFSFGLDIDTFSAGIIPANLHGNGNEDLVSGKPLLADDLFNIAIHAVEFGYLGTAATVMKTALKAPRARAGDEVFEKKMRLMAKNIVKLHNGYLDRQRSVFTDSHALRPYLLDDNLDKRSKQPKYVKSGKVNHPENILPSVMNDGGQYLMRSSMLQSCGGVRVKENQALNRAYVPNIPEGNTHKCVLVHHKNPYTKLGPFKIEYVHHDPFFLIIHDLLTEEDMEYLKVWATPRLSRKRQIYEGASEDQVKRGEWVEEENGDVIKHYRRTVRKSIQEGIKMCILQRTFISISVALNSPISGSFLQNIYPQCTGLAARDRLGPRHEAAGQSESPPGSGDCQETREGRQDEPDRLARLPANAGKRLLQLVK